jgi:hypothetical protein
VVAGYGYKFFYFFEARKFLLARLAEKSEKGVNPSSSCGLRRDRRWECVNPHSFLQKLNMGAGERQSMQRRLMEF